MNMDKFLKDVRSSLSTHGAPGLEIEFRLGHKKVGNPRFTPGVPLDGFQKVAKLLDDSPSFAPSQETETIDYYFRNMEGRLCSDGTWIRKQKISTCDGQESGGCVRCSASYEVLEKTPAGATPSSSSFFRKKTRRSYTWKTLPWRVDLTVVQTNEDPDSEDNIYEIEVELANPEAVYVSPIHNLVDCGSKIANDLKNVAFGSK